MRKPIFTASFFSAMLPLAIPIALQNLLSASFRLVDTLMIGQLGDTSIAAVGLAGNVSFFVELIAFGLASGSVVFMAQYHGAGNHSAIRRCYSCALLYALPISIAILTATLFFPNQLMTIVTDDPLLIAEGSKYLQYCCFSYLGIMLGLVTSATLRSTENVKLSMVASGISAVSNAILNYTFIFGNFGAPEMGVAGAGLATTISSLINPTIMIIVSIAQKNVLYAPIKEYLKLDGFFKVYTKKAFPVLFNEIIWSLSVIGLNMVYGRMGEDNYAALTVYRTIENIVFVIFVGICHSCNILVGMRLGAKRVEEAKSLAKQYIAFIPIVGTIMGVLVLLFRNPILGLFDISVSAHETAQILLFIFAFDVTIRNIPYISVVGIFRAGGDAKIGLVGDLIVNYCMVLPCAILAGLVFELPFVLTYLIAIAVDDIAKCLIFLPHLFSMKWIKSVID